MNEVRWKLATHIVRAVETLSVALYLGILLRGSSALCYQIRHSAVTREWLIGNGQHASTDNEPVLRPT